MKQNQESPGDKNQPPANDSCFKQIILALNSGIQDYVRKRDEAKADKKFDRKWRRLEVIGLWTAALVGLIAIWVANKDSRGAERAYVVPDPTNPIEIVSYGEKDKIGDVVWRISPLWTNSGNTPASRATIYTTFNLIPNPTPGIVIIGKNVYPPNGEPSTSDFSDKVPTGLFFGPKEVKRGDTHSFSGAAMNGFSISGTTLNVISLATYIDAFGDRHQTMICRFVDLPKIDYTSANQSAPLSGVSSDCPVYNCTDDECRQYTTQKWWPKDAFDE